MRLSNRWISSFAFVILTAKSSIQVICGYRINARIITRTLPVNQDSVYYVAVDSFMSLAGSYTVSFELK